MKRLAVLVVLVLVVSAMAATKTKTKTPAASQIYNYNLIIDLDATVAAVDSKKAAIETQLKKDLNAKTVVVGGASVSVAKFGVQSSNVSATVTGSSMTSSAAQKKLEPETGEYTLADIMVRSVVDVVQVNDFTLVVVLDVNYEVVIPKQPEIMTAVEAELNAKLVYPTSLTFAGKNNSQTELELLVTRSAQVSSAAQKTLTASGYKLGGFKVVSVEVKAQNNDYTILMSADFGSDDITRALLQETKNEMAEMFKILLNAKSVTVAVTSSTKFSTQAVTLSATVLGSSFTAAQAKSRLTQEGELSDEFKILSVTPAKTNDFTLAMTVDTTTELFFGKVNDIQIQLQSDLNAKSVSVSSGAARKFGMQTVSATATVTGSPYTPKQAETKVTSSGYSLVGLKVTSATATPSAGIALRAALWWVVGVVGAGCAVLVW